MKARLTVEEYFTGIRSGDRAVLAKAITLAESSLPSDRDIAMELLNKIQPYTGQSLRIGITGIPGVGKSTFIESFGIHLVSLGYKIAVLAIDPTSRISKGSILGDKTRMSKLASHPDAFIRPTPSGDSAGGVSRATRESILLTESAGFDIVIVETVGVGQSETVVHSMVDFFLLLLLAGAGDELQGIKRGIMELADGVVINKADGENLLRADRARAEFEGAMHFFPLAEDGWRSKVLTCSSTEGKGISEIWEMISSFENDQRASGWFLKNRQLQSVEWMRETMDWLLQQEFIRSSEHKQLLHQLEAEVKEGRISPTVAAGQLVKSWIASLKQN